MPKKHLNVLSIDFDYFQKVAFDTIKTCYPDGIDLPAELSTIVWSSYYANPNTEKLLQLVSTDKTQLAQLCTLLTKQESKTPVCIANSHVHIYDFIHKYVDKFNAKTTDVVNIDMHHNLFNDNPEIDCGNWLMHIAKDFPDGKIFWISNPISNEAYGLGEEFDDIINHSIEEIKNTKYDIIFLCRSDNWLPPHLDGDFDDLKEFMAKHFAHILIDNQIKKPRDYQALANSQRKQILTCINQKDII